MHLHVIAVALLPLLSTTPAEQQFLGRLRSDNVRIGYLAGMELAAKGRDAIPIVVGEVRSGHVGHGLRTAIRQLGASAVPPLLSLLDESCCRRDAARMLTQVECLYAGDVLDRALLAEVRSAFRGRSDTLIPDMVAQLGKDPFAASVLGLVGDPAVPALLPLLRDPRASNSALSALALMGEDADGAIPELIDLLETTPGGRLRIDAARVLTAIGQPAVAALTEALERPRAQYPAALALAALQARPLETLLPILVDPPPTQAGGDAMDWWTGVGELCWIGTPAYQYLLRRVADGDRRAAELVAAIAAEGTRGTCWAMGLSRGRSRLARSRSDFQSLTTLAVPVLEGAAHVPTTRAAALNALAELGKPDSVLAVAKSEDASTRADAARAAGHLRRSRDAERQFLLLSDLLNDADPLVRYQAARSVPANGPHAAAILDLLLQALRRADDRTCSGMIQIVSKAARARKGGAPAQAARAIVPFLVRRHCDVYATEHLQQLAPSSIPALIAALSVNDAAAWKALSILARLGERAASGSSTLGGMLSSPDRLTRRKAAEALSTVGRGAQAAVPQLVQCLSDAEVRWSCATALGAVGLPAVESLELALADPLRRLPAIVALGEIGPPASAAVPALRKAQGSADAEVSSAAAAAIGQILPSPVSR